MRMIIKNADFSSVSIGKVVKDLSFSFTAEDGNDAINAFFINYNNGSFTRATIYLGNSGNPVTGSTSNGRTVTDFIEVTGGMKINLQRVYAPSNSPTVIAFDADKNILSSKCRWETGYAPYTYIVPEGVKYIKLQSQGIETTYPYTTCSGTMPQ